MPASRGHGGMLRKRAIEHDPFAGRGRARAACRLSDVFGQIRIGGVERAGYHPSLLALARPAQVNQGDVGVANRLHGL